MNWRSKISSATKKDALAVMKWRPMVKLEPRIDKCSIDSISYKELTLREYSKIQVHNSGFHRIKAVLAAKKKGVSDVGSLAELAFPPKDRPRGKRDIASVIYHTTTSKKVSPIVIARRKSGTGKSRFILLDGVHRSVAVAVRGGRIKVAIFDLKEQT